MNDAHTEPKRLTAGRKRLILAATVLGSAMGFIDGSVVNVALPAIQRDLHAGAGAIQWVINAYLLTLGALVLIGGAAGDRLGRKAVFLAGLALFTLASIGCGLAPNSTLLILARAVQGAGAALLTPSSLAILGSSFPDSERSKAMGAWAGFGALTTAFGPVLGGWLVDAVSWRAIFFLNVPLALGAATLALTAIPESKDERALPLDWSGAAIVAAGLASLTWGLTAAPDRGFGDRIILAALAAGVLLLVGFLAWEARSKHPMMPLELFRSRPFSGTNLLTLLLYFALSGAMVFLPYDLIRVQGFSATRAGASLLPFALIMGVFSGVAGRLADRIGPRWPLTVGPMVAGAGIALLALPGPGAGYWTGYLPGVVVMAIGMTAVVGPLTAAVMGSVESRHAGLASGVNNATARIASLLAVAILGVVLFEAFALIRGGADLRARMAAVMSGQDRSAAGLVAFHGAVHGVMLISAACAALAGVAGFVSLARARCDQMTTSDR